MSLPQIEGNFEFCWLKAWISKAAGASEIQQVVKICDCFIFNCTHWEWCLAVNVRILLESSNLTAHKDIEEWISELCCVLSWTAGTSWTELGEIQQVVKIHDRFIFNCTRWVWNLIVNFVLKITCLNYSKHYTWP